MSKNYRINAVVYCDDLNSEISKPTRELLKYSDKYNIIAIIDPLSEEKRTQNLIDLKQNVPIVVDFQGALNLADTKNIKLYTLIIGVYDYSLTFNKRLHEIISQAIQNNLNVVSGLNILLKENRLFRELAKIHNVELVDLRETERIVSEVKSNTKIDAIIISVLGTDSDIGKRDTCRKIVENLRIGGYKVEMVGTGLISSLQGTKYGLILDSYPHHSIPNGIHNILHDIWINEHPHFIIIEGQRNLLNPVLPGDLETLVALSPDIVLLQHSPNRKYYKSKPDVKIHSLQRQIKAIEMISGKTVSAIVLNCKELQEKDIEENSRRIKIETDLPTYTMDDKDMINLTKYIIKLSGRVNSNKLKFQRRAATIIYEE